MYYKILQNKYNDYLTHVLYTLIQKTGRHCQLVQQIDETDNSNNNIIYILSFFQHTNILPKYYIVFQVEQMHCAKLTEKVNYKKAIQDAIQCWDYNTKNQSYYTTKCAIWMPIPVIFHNNPFTITSLRNETDTIDVLFYGSINKRRHIIMKYLTRIMRPIGIRVKIITKLYNNDLYTWIRRSKIVLNLGFYPNTLLATYRLNEILSHQRAIITEQTTFEQDKHIISQYERSGVMFIPRIDTQLTNVYHLTQAINVILNESVEQYEQRIEKGRNFIIEKENFFLHHIDNTLSQVE